MCEKPVIPSWRLRIVLVSAAAVGIPVTTSILYTFPPAEYHFYPPCALNRFTGLHCPGCGATRSLHALLHGDLPQALAYNALFVLLSPLLAYGASCLAFSVWTGRPAPGLRLSSRLTKILLALIIAYGIARNFDMYPLRLLAPHTLPDRPRAAMIGSGTEASAYALR